MKSLNDAGMDGAMLVLVVYGAAATAFVPTIFPHARQLAGRWRTLLTILISGGAWNLLFTFAMISGDASRAVLLYYLSTLWMVIGARLFLREPLGALRIACAGIALLGAALVLDPREMVNGRLSLPDLYAIGAGMAHAITCLAFRFAADLPVTSKNAFMFVGTVIGAGALLSLSQATPGASCVSTNAFLLAFAFGLCWVMVADSLVQFGVSHIPSARAGILMLCELPITVISAAIIANERLGPLELIGGGLIMVASLVECCRAEESPDATGVASPAAGETPTARDRIASSG
jgi:drug/metabolite transporter (DMT)-like permease